MKRFPANSALRRAALLALWTLLAVAAVWAGLNVRQRTFEATTEIRFGGDVANATRVGRRVLWTALRQDAAHSAMRPATRPAFPTWPSVWSAYLEQYDAEYARVGDRPTVDDSAYRFDYPPGRLLVVTAWARHAAETVGLRVPYDDAMVAPMLRVNVAHELLAAAGAFALVRRTFRRAGRSVLTSEALAWLAALLLWFNPALILNAHAWPQWDAWVLPYALWAAYFGVAGRWALAGAALAIGAMFKGQVLLIAPLFALWPLFRLDLDALLRFAAGFVFAVAVATSPWTLWRATEPAIPWAIVAIALGAAHICWPRARLGWAWWAIGVALVAWLVGGATLYAGAAALVPALALGLAIVLLPSEWRGRRLAPAVGYAGVVVLMAGAWLGGSFAWLHVGFQTARYPVMTMGNVANVPGVLAAFHGIGTDTRAPSLPLLGWPTTARELLQGLAYVGVALAALALARRDRARDPNLLVPLVAAWTIVYALMPQMHERYLLWAAATSALLATRGVGGLIACVTLSTLQSAMVLCSMIETNARTSDPTYMTWYHAMKPMQPSAGYAVATIAAVLLIWSFAPSRAGAVRGDH